MFIDSLRLSLRLFFVVLAATMLLAGPIAVQAQVPRTLSFQGVLADPTGKPKANATYTVTFRLYDALSGGNLLWTEAGKPVVVNGGKGLFSTLLGTPTSFGALAFDRPYFLEVQVSGDAGMTPRIPLQSAPYALNAWSTGGNADTDPATQFLGTTDNRPFVLRANGHRVMQFEDAANAAGTIHSVNTLGGGEANTIAPGVVGATISGGGGTGAHQVLGDFAVIAGGSNNFADVSPHEVIGGGSANIAQGGFTVIGGGRGNNTQGDYTTISGGSQNYALGQHSTIGGGDQNSVTQSYATVGGGTGNTAAIYSTVGGGSSNRALSYGATVAGGYFNTAGLQFGTGDHAAIGGGLANVVRGNFGTVPGGYNSQANADYSFAAGRRAFADHAGSFVWADSTDANFNSTAPNQFAIRAAGGLVLETGQNAHIYTGAAPTELNRYLLLLNSFGRPSASGLKAGGILCADDFSYANPAKNNTVVKGTLAVGYPDPAPYAFAVNGTTYSQGGYSSSDARFKREVHTLDGSLASVLSLRGVSFEWDREGWKDRNFPGGRQMGFIAQEVEKVLPEVVSTDANGFKAVSYQSMIPVLVEAMKEQERRIERLESANVELMRKNAATEERLKRLEEAIADRRP